MQWSARPSFSQTSCSHYQFRASGAKGYFSSPGYNILVFDMEVLWLSEDDVKAVLSMDDAIAAVESAFLEQGLGGIQMPPKTYLYFSKYSGDLRAMPAFLEGLDLAGVKVVNSHAGNPERGLPSVMAMMVLISPQTGAPLAVLAGTYLTSMRTGAAGAIAAKLLARPDSQAIGLIGAGAQARTQLLGLSKHFEIDCVKVYDISIDRCRSLEKDCQAFLDCKYLATTDPQDACKCDILVTTTPSRSPIVKEAWILPGTHINAIGADAKGKQELETALTRRAKVVVDEISQAIHSGEINVPISQGGFKPDDIYAQIGDLVAGKISGRSSREEITIFDSTGLAIQDVAAASVILKKAAASNLGLRLKLL